VNQRNAIIAGIITAFVLAAIPAYQPAQFRYAIWRLESAKTVAQERSACLLARRVGRIWEVNKVHTHEFQSLPSRVKHGPNDEVTEIVWLKGRWRDMGKPYRAYRVFLDPENRELLRGSSTTDVHE
jgi:hypothetical protein